MAVIFKAICVFPLLIVSAHAHVFSFPSSDFGDAQKAIEKFETGNNAIGSGNNNAETGYNGKWELVSENSGVSAMHAILLPKIDKVLMYDATVWRTSEIPLPPQKMPCRVADQTTGELDCWCHSVLFDIETSELTALKVHSTYIKIPFYNCYT